MTILFNACGKIKPTNRLFGARIQVPRGPKVRPYSDEDADFWAAECAAAENRKLDEVERDWADQDRVCRGVIYA